MGIGKKKYLLETFALETFDFIKVRIQHSLKVNSVDTQRFLIPALHLLSIVDSVSSHVDERVCVFARKRT